MIEIQGQNMNACANNDLQLQMMISTKWAKQISSFKSAGKIRSWLVQMHWSINWFLQLLLQWSWKY